MDIRVNQPLASQQTPAPPVRTDPKATPAAPGAVGTPGSSLPAAQRLQFRSLDQIRPGMRDYYHQVRSAQQRFETLEQGRAAVLRAGEALASAERFTAAANASDDPDERVALATEAQRQTQFATVLRQGEALRRAAALIGEGGAPGRGLGPDDLAHLSEAFASAAAAAGEEAERAQSVEDAASPIREEDEARRVLDGVAAQLAGSPAAARALQTNVAAPAAAHLLR